MKYISILHGKPYYSKKGTSEVNTTEIIKNLGFLDDINCEKVNNVLKDGAKFSNIHIDIYSENPFNLSPIYMLLLRTVEDNIIVDNNKKRLIIKKNDKYKTHFMNIIQDRIIESFYRITDNYIDLVLNVQNVYYRISIDNSGNYN